jgi:quercetin 2,3-dioxygenase
MTPLTELPNATVPYVLEAGGGRGHQLIDQVGRCVVGAEESGEAMSVMTLVGPKGWPIPLHYHDHEFEFFYCYDGQVQLWADEESRLLIPGDFGYIPPGTVHSYQLHRAGSSFVGPIIPAGWDRFFDLCGTPYSGPAYAPGPYLPPPFEKFQQAEIEFNMKYRPDMSFTPPSDAAPDDALPGEQRAYFLRRGEGTRHLLGGQLQTALCTSAETGGRIAMTTVELPRGATMPAHTHARTHETLIVLDGVLSVTLDDAAHTATRGDTVNVPAGCAHAYAAQSGYAKVLTMSAPGGLERLFALAGEPTDQPIFPTGPAAPPDPERLAAAAAELDVSFA